jgi:hypothetical protein
MERRRTYSNTAPPAGPPPAAPPPPSADPEPTPGERWLTGLDLGQAQDYSALAAVAMTEVPAWDNILPGMVELADGPYAGHRVEVPAAVDLIGYPFTTGETVYRRRGAGTFVRVAQPEPGVLPRGPHPRRHYACRAIKRWPLGTSYPAIVEAVKKNFERPLFAGSDLILDYTGVGRPVYDLFRRSSIRARLVPVTITAGTVQTTDGQGFHVAKVILIGNLQTLLQTRRLQFADKMPEAAVLVRELQNYRVKVTQAANETFDAREGQHDDTVLALALACWRGERALARLNVLC